MTDVGQAFDVGIDAGYDFEMSREPIVSENCMNSVNDAIFQGSGSNLSAGLPLRKERLLKLEVC